MLWVGGGLLVLALVAAGVLCAHAGGHVAILALPAVVVAVAWVVAASEGQGELAWWLAAMGALAIAAGVGSSARHQRARRSRPLLPAPHGGSGTAVTPLAPMGVVRVAGEMWTARSLSGTLAAGAPVHVVRVDGVRLDVWSEAGTVPDQSTLDSEEEPTT